MLLNRLFAECVLGHNTNDGTLGRPITQARCSVAWRRVREPARRGPVGEKKSEGANASLSSPVSQVASPPPLVPDLQSKIPFHITCVVLCYWQHAAHQRLAMVGQTTGVRIAGLPVGERQLTGRRDARRGRRGGAGARGRLVWRGGRNAFSLHTNYSPLHCALPPHTLTAHTLTRSSLFFAFLLPCYAIALNFALV